VGMKKKGSRSPSKNRIKVRRIRRQEQENIRRVIKEARDSTSVIFEVDRLLVRAGFSFKQRCSILGEVSAYAGLNASNSSDEPDYTTFARSLPDGWRDDLDSMRKLH